jgi:hypothetical protein
VEEGLINEAKDATYRKQIAWTEIHTDEKDASQGRFFLLIALPPSLAIPRINQLTFHFIYKISNTTSSPLWLSLVKISLKN